MHPRRVDRKCISKYGIDKKKSSYVFSKLQLMLYLNHLRFFLIDLFFKSLHKDVKPCKNDVNNIILLHVLLSEALILHNAMQANAFTFI